MASDGRLEVAILGGGPGTAPLLNLLGHLHDIQLAGLASPASPSKEGQTSFAPSLLPSVPRLEGSFANLTGSTPRLPLKRTGLGLHSVRPLVQNHHGTIGGKSRVGQGTCFHLKSPNPSVSESP